MRAMKAWRTTLCWTVAILPAPAAWAQGCTWPVQAQITTQAQYAQPAVAVVPGLDRGPLLAGGLRRVPPPPNPALQPRLVSPASRTHILIEQRPADPESVSVKLTSTVDISHIEQDLPGLIHRTSAWQAFQARLSCEKNAHSYEYQLIPQGETTTLRLGFVAERRVCPGIGGGFRAAGARVAIETPIRAVVRGDQIAFEGGEPVVKVSTSPEQDFLLGMIGGGLAFGHVGVELVRDLQEQAKDSIRQAATGPLGDLGSASLPTPAGVPPSIRIKPLSAVLQRSATGALELKIISVAPDQRAGTTCAWIKRRSAR
ncbi:hypothetical protein [Caulobacter mirabilis]|uniref:Uncharacterized protein n=1 Tax=Caulobacter mirabilis TaxID=69666 RepID=A0A2D2AUG6_9CAUL|nr:hypothetical protein [Caulobacter mirabilis]ATQ41662.1 hypothetical protein CSW64_04165 [Caulobacter mirabilis]